MGVGAEERIRELASRLDLDLSRAVVVRERQIPIGSMISEIRREEKLNTGLAILMILDALDRRDNTRIAT